RRPGRKAGALVVLSHGKLVLYVERGGKTLLSWTSDPEVLVPAAMGLAEAVRGGALGRLTVERADGTGVYDTPLAQALADAGFRPTPRGPRLPGSAWRRDGPWQFTMFAELRSASPAPAVSIRGPEPPEPPRPRLGLAIYPRPSPRTPTAAAWASDLPTAEP